jgi:hypothetical protein
VGSVTLAYELLGPVRVSHDGHELDVGTPQQCAVLGLFLLAEGRSRTTYRAVFLQLSDLINDQRVYTTLYLPDHPGQARDLRKQTLRRVQRSSGTFSAVLRKWLLHLCSTSARQKVRPERLTRYQTLTLERMLRRRSNRCTRQRSAIRAAAARPYARPRTPTARTGPASGSPCRARTRSLPARPDRRCAVAHPDHEAGRRARRNQCLNQASQLVLDQLLPLALHHNRSRSTTNAPRSPRSNPSHPADRVTSIAALSFS